MDNYNTPQLMKSLNELYSKKEYEKAVALLEQNSQVLDKGTFHYNLGTLNLKLSHWGKARFHFEKAKKLGVDDPALQVNLAYTQTKIPGADLSNSSQFIDRWNETLTSISYSHLLIFGLSLCLIVMVFLKWKKSFKLYSLILAIIISAIPLTSKFVVESRLQTGVVLRETEIYEGPSGIFESKGKVGAGTKILFGMEKENWVFIKSPLDYVGWIAKKELGRL